MGGEQPRTRRVVLSGLGAMTLGTVGGTVTAQERDPSDYDRPQTVVENGVEFTMMDCSRVIVDGDPSRIARIEVPVIYLDYYAEYYDEPTIIDDVLIVTGFDLPVDINVNSHIDDFDPEQGSVIVHGLVVYDGADEPIANPPWPQSEWDCHDVMRMELDPEFVEGFQPIDYRYETLSD